MALTGTAIEILDRIERLEAERIVLSAFINNLRDASGQQLSAKEVLSEHEVRPILGGVQARNAELRQSILLARDDKVAENLLEGLSVPPQNAKGYLNLFLFVCACNRPVVFANYTPSKRDQTYFADYHAHLSCSHCHKEGLFLCGDARFLQLGWNLEIS